MRSVAYSPDGRHIISRSDDNTIRIWDAGTGAAVGSPLKGHTSLVHSVAYSPDGRHIVSGSNDRTVRIWDAEASVIISDPLEGHMDWAQYIAPSPDGRHIRTWGAAAGTAAGKPLEECTYSVQSIAYSDGEHIASGSYGNTTRVLDTIPST